jgi:hypothetical protein
MKQQTSVRVNTWIDDKGALRRSIVDFLRWSDQEYTNLQYFSGLAYLDEYLKGDQHYIEVLARAKIFWAWWRNHWAIRDRSFVDMVGNVILNDVQVRRDLYTEYNDGRALAGSIHPHSLVLTESYAEMISTLVREQQKKV